MKIEDNLPPEIKSSLDLILKLSPRIQVLEAYETELKTLRAEVKAASDLIGDWARNENLHSTDT